VEKEKIDYEMQDSNNSGISVIDLINYKIFLVILIIFAIPFLFYVLSINQIPIASAVTSGQSDTTTKLNNFLIASVHTEKGVSKLHIPLSKLLFNVTINFYPDGNFKSLKMGLKPNLSSFYKKAAFPTKSQDAVFVYPIFTQAAYGSNGFYSYYHKNCDMSCLTVSIPHNAKGGTYSSSIDAAFVLTLLNYSHITDIDIDKNPDILKKFDKVIIMHNEYVTQKEFDAITNHPNVVYLFPNALYAKVTTNYQQDSITLVRGHGYPDKTISNGFGWENDNSKYEYNFKCHSWKFYSTTNGKMLNCYPDYRVLYDDMLLLAIKN
jgi:hypothetical protein